MNTQNLIKELSKYPNVKDIKIKVNGKESSFKLEVTKEAFILDVVTKQVITPKKEKEDDKAKA